MKLSSLKICLTALLLFAFEYSIAQTEKYQKIIDSLHKVKNKSADTTLYNVYINLSLAQRSFNLDSALFYSHKALKSYKGEKKYLRVRLTGNVAIHLEMAGKYDSSLIYLKKAKIICKNMEACKPCGSILNSMGIVYEKTGEMAKAADSYLEALAIFEKIKLTPGIMLVSNNLGIVYRVMQKYDKAKKHFQTVIDAGYENAGPGYPLALINMSACLSEESNHTEARKLLLEAIMILTKDYHPIHLHTAYTTIAEVEIRDSNKTQAIYYLKKANELSASINNKEGIINVKLHLARLLSEEKRYDEADKLYKESIVLSYEINLKKKLIESIELYFTNSFLNRHDEINYQYFKDLLENKELLLNEENNKAIIDAEEKYENAKKEKQILEERNKVQLLEKNKEIDKANLKNQKIYTWSAIGGVGLLLLFSIFIWNRFTVTKKQKKIIENQKAEVDLQKKIVEEKNHEILDSINYARRLQEAILPPQKIVKEYLNESFILYKPKDIVAGDFYFLEPLGNKVVFAAADCTGHGVPGAMVSVVCSNALNRAVKEFKLTESGKILDKVRELVNETFAKSEGQVKDGMDISLCVFDYENRIISWSGANNPIWIIKKGSNEISEIKADKQPIGVYADPFPFNTHEIKTEPGDLIYIFTDGYADQFGGENGKKFKASNLKNLFLSIQHLSMEKQREEINLQFEKWRGKLEQIDDVCVIGVRV